MSGGINAKYLALDEDIAEPSSITDNFIIYSDVVDDRVKIKF